MKFKEFFQKDKDITGKLLKLLDSNFKKVSKQIEDDKNLKLDRFHYTIYRISEQNLFILWAFWECKTLDSKPTTINKTYSVDEHNKVQEYEVPNNFNKIAVKI